MGAASGTVLTVFRQRTYMVLVVPVNVWQFVSLSCSFLARGRDCAYERSGDARRLP